MHWKMWRQLLLISFCRLFLNRPRVVSPGGWEVSENRFIDCMAGSFIGEKQKLLKYFQDLTRHVVAVCPFGAGGGRDNHIHDNYCGC